MNILSVDFGTSSLKMTLINEKGDFLRAVKVEYPYDADDMKLQIEAERIYGAFVKACGELTPEERASVEGLAFCVFSPCLIALDRDGSPLYPAILHIDRRSYAQSERAVKNVGKETFHRINGNLPFAGGISCTSMMWIKDEYPDIYERTYKFGHLNTFMHRRFTGEWLIEPTNASFTGLYETLKVGGWSEELCRGTGIDINKLPDIRPTLSMSGYLTERVAKDTGLKQGLPVITGSNDSSAASFGAGAVNPGDIMNIAGSSEIMNVTVDHPVPNDGYYIRTSVEEGKWLYLSITSGGFSIEWFRQIFCSEMDKKYFYDKYITSVIKNEPKPYLYFAPHLAGDRHSLEMRRGAFEGLTLDTTREDMLLVLLLGTFEPLVNLINLSRTHVKLNPDIYLTGGLNSEGYRQFKNRVFDGFNFVSKTECSTRGNFEQAKRVLGF